MASFRQRNGKWQAQVRRNGHTPLTKSFLSKKDAMQWARQTEAELDAAVLRVDRRVLSRTTVRDLLQRYQKEITPNKRGKASEKKRIDAFLRQPWADRTLDKLSAQDFVRYRDTRLKARSAGTVIRDLGLLHAIFEASCCEWDIPLPENPISKLRKPKTPNARERRLEPGELDLLLNAAEQARNDWLIPAIELAVETGMRRGELLSIRWRDIDLSTSTLLIRETKNGHPRRIPLTAKATGVLQHRMKQDRPADERVFIVSGDAFRQCWERCKRRAAEQHSSILDLRFHDLRHEAVSRFFELGLSVPEVALISGHRDPRMLFRYTHLRAEDVVLKLRTTAKTSGPGQQYERESAASVSSGRNANSLMNSLEERAV
ncbi:site-specific integrase [Nitratireductor aquimarinus]|uniref:tyrosine-type recombinase/integrase n=1 Tax=Nitratireductor aquimarinus TaxID=889300 RepID=UPI0029361612|nr:site-specific integrase [Nitratireductor aquimarinus]MDV2968611.1 site-specific integrase [Nitratireductor aquimarinus]